MPGPAERNEPHRSGRAATDEHRENPGQRPEPRRNRRADHFFVAVIRDELGLDLVAIETTIDHFRELASHLMRRPARILAALRDVDVPAAARADDFVLHLAFE